jgi:hypothetical protein
MTKTITTNKKTPLYILYFFYEKKTVIFTIRMKIPRIIYG